MKEFKDNYYSLADDIFLTRNNYDYFENKNKLYKDFGIKGLLTLDQIHSKDILLIKRRDNHTAYYVVLSENEEPEDFEVIKFKDIYDLCSTQADGVITDLPINLGIYTADCLCVFGKSRNITFALHSGWRGTGILDYAIKLAYGYFETKSTEFSYLFAPCISVSCYEFSENDANEFQNSHGKNTVKTNEDCTKFFVDIKTANKNILEKHGYKEFIDIDECTFSNKNLSSYRRDGRGYLKMLNFMINQLVV